MQLRQLRRAVVRGPAGLKAQKNPCNREKPPVEKGQKQKHPRKRKQAAAKAPAGPKRLPGKKTLLVVAKALAGADKSGFSYLIRRPARCGPSIFVSFYGYAKGISPDFFFA